MAGSGGMGQLLKGMIIGIVLLLAIVGTMSIFDKEGGFSFLPGNKEASQTNNAPNIPAPPISIPSQDSPLKTPATDSSNISEQLSDQNKNSKKETPTNGFTPTLEGEKTTEDIAAEKAILKKEAEEKTKEIEYGMLDLGVVNPNNKEKLKADYAVFDQKNNKVAESKSTENTSFRLPVGEYRVVTTLVNTNKTSRKTEPVQTTNTIEIRANQTSSKIFNLEPASILGVLQVSAINANNNQAIRANFIVQKENGETVATRKNVTASLFKLNAGSYKITVKSGDNSDFKTIVVEPGESTQEVFKLQEAFKLGRVLVRIFDSNTNTPLSADINISTLDGTSIQSLKAVSQTEISLPAADYRIRVTGPNGQSSKKIRVNAGKVSSEVFRFDAPLKSNPDLTPNTNQKDGQITNNVRITGTKVDNDNANTSATTETQNIEAPTQIRLANLKLFARDSQSQQAIKSNFYVQTNNGKHIAKKIYADSAEFNLPAGTYRITVRSKGRSNVIRTIQVSAGQDINQSFALKSNTNQASTPKPKRAPPKPAPQKNNTIPNGFLNVQMQPARNTHFIISTKSGKKIVELTSVPSGNFKLDAGQYVVTAIHNNTRRKKNVLIQRGKTAKMIFRANEFVSQRTAPTQNNASQNNQLSKGVLRSRIVDRSGRPLRGNLTVTNIRGQVVARANAVTVGVFDLPPEPHTVIVDYQGLRGSERVKIISRETTVQTFTITPNNNTQAPKQPENRSIEQRLKDRIKEEIEKQF